MTVERIDAATGEVVTMATEAEARRGTERIRVALDRVATAWQDLGERITEAYQRRYDLALGFDSWAAYADAELRPSGTIAAEVRRELVALLSAQGMSTRAIAPTVGVSDITVRRDQREVRHDVAPAPEAEDRWKQLAREDADRRETEARNRRETEALRVTGLDGKTYTRPEPAATPKRAPLPQQVQSAGWDLAKSVDRIKRLADDDRFTSHQKEVAPHLRSHLTHAIEVCQDLLDRINN